MVSDGDTSVRAKLMAVRAIYLTAPTSRPTPRKPALSWRQAIYRRLGQMFMRWAETAGDE